MYELLKWVVSKSMAVRGVTTVLDGSVAAAAAIAWQNEVYFGGRSIEVISNRYPVPTPLTVCWSTTIEAAGQWFGSSIPAFGGPGNPALVVAPPFDLNNQGVLRLDWTCGGARFFAFADLGAGALSLPGVDWVRVGYWSNRTDFFVGGGGSARLDVSLLPQYVPGCTATLTSAPVVLPAGGTELTIGSPGLWVTQYTPLVRDQTVFRDGGAPVGDSACVVQPNYNIFGGGTPYAASNLQNFAGGIGVSAVNTKAFCWSPLNGYRFFTPAGSNEFIATVAETIAVVQ